MKLSREEMVKNVQALQHTSYHLMYAAETQHEKNKHTNSYNETVKTLIQLLGENAHCNEVDCDLWGYFSDYYKDVNGFRPRHYMTRKDVETWITEDHEIVDN